MQERVRDISRKAIDRLQQWLEGELDATLRCRECDAPVHPNDSVCQRCGAGAPARVSHQLSAVLLGFGVLIMLLAFVLFR
jgi:hypothetical protein